MPVPVFARCLDEPLYLLFGQMLAASSGSCWASGGELFVLDSLAQPVYDAFLAWEISQPAIFLLGVGP
jgi:hypothetical protein